MTHINSMQTFNKKREFDAFVASIERMGKTPVVEKRNLFVDGELVAVLDNNWGGSRGGGRPKGINTVALTVRISTEAAKLLSNVGNKSKLVDSLILKALGQDAER